MAERNILVIIGPSGAGKSTVIRRVTKDPRLIIQPTWTTRPPRPGEQVASSEHIFVDDEEFQNRRKTGYFIDTVKMFSLPYWYGLPHMPEPDGKVVIVILRAALVPLFAKRYPSHIIYQIYDDSDRIKQRLQNREAEGEFAGGRRAEFEKEIQFGAQLAHRSFYNENVGNTVNGIKAAIKADFVI